MKTQSLVSRCCAALLALIIALPGRLPGSWGKVSAAGLSAGNTYTVNSTLDTPAADAAGGICADAQGNCTLRAAVMVANFAKGADTIILPAGVYTLTRPGFEDAALVGDLDISDDLTIQGAGSGVTTVDGNGTVTGDRVFQILSTAHNVTLSGLTISAGRSLTSTVGVIGGGGIYMEGAGNLHLSDLIITGNTALNGGGLYGNFSQQGGSVEMDRVILHANQAKAGGVGAGAGAFIYLPSSSSTVTVQDSQVYSNTADGTGGGFFVEGTTLAHWRIDRSQIYSNTAASGGGIGNFVALAMSGSRLHNNRATFDGGAIEAFSPYTIISSTLDVNSAGRFGGAIFDLETGSGEEFAGITQSTLNNNYALDGGAIYHDGYITNPSRLTLTNSTLSNNAVSNDGGGLFVYHGDAQLFNDTIADNRVQLRFPRPGPGIGGGLYITATSALTVENTIIAKNWRGNGILIPTPDDCVSSGTTGELAFDLILTTANCFVTGPQGGNITGQDPLLGPLLFNGGATQTQALLPGSPAIDTGAQTGCTGLGGIPITVDQRGYPRPYGPRCDIGAVEYTPNDTSVFLPFTLK